MSRSRITTSATSSSAAENSGICSEGGLPWRSPSSNSLSSEWTRAISVPTSRGLSCQPFAQAVTKTSDITSLKAETNGFNGLSTLSEKNHARAFIVPQARVKFFSGIPKLRAHAMTNAYMDERMKVPGFAAHCPASGAKPKVAAAAISGMESVAGLSRRSGAPHWPLPSVVNLRRMKARVPRPATTSAGARMWQREFTSCGACSGESAPFAVCRT
jgi:hypothetical protein